MSRQPGELRRVDRFPNGRAAAVFRVLRGGARADLYFAGPRTTAHLKQSAGFDYAVQVEFGVGWAGAVLGVAAHELADELVSAENLWGRFGADLCAELQSATSPLEALAPLARAFGARAARAGSACSGVLARRAAPRLARGERVGAVADRMGVTARHLRRAFRDSVSVGPKDFTRSTRLEHALALATARLPWAQVAREAGYYDQSHLVAEFRALVGLTPTALLARLTGAQERSK